MDAFISQLQPLKDDEMVDLAIRMDVVIKYKDEITIYISLYETEYCSYTLTNSEYSSLSYIPAGMYEWLSEKLK